MNDTHTFAAAATRLARNSVEPSEYDRIGRESAQHPLNPDQIARQLRGFEPALDRRRSPALDAFCRAKGLSIHALQTMGARVKDAVIAFPSAAGIKFRRMDNGQRWSRGRFRDHPLNIFYAPAEPYTSLILAEGETDAAALIEAYRTTADVAVMPLGAAVWSEIWTAQLAPYPVIYVATDADEHGEQAWQELRDTTDLPLARHRPPAPHKDWCDRLAKNLQVPPLGARASSEFFRNETQTMVASSSEVVVVQPRRPE